MRLSVRTRGASIPEPPETAVPPEAPAIEPADILEGSVDQYEELLVLARRPLPPDPVRPQDDAADDSEEERGDGKEEF